MKSHFDHFKGFFFLVCLAVGNFFPKNNLLNYFVVTELVGAAACGVNPACMVVMSTPLLGLNCFNTLTILNKRPVPCDRSL